MEQNIELMASGIKCDNPDCGWRDDNVKSDDYPEWLNRPCPNCGENLLTEEDMNSADLLRLAVDFMNTLTPEEVEQLGEIAKQNGIEETDFLKDALGKQNLTEGEVTAKIEVHNGIRVTEIKNKE